jgi:hypothetical protein
MPGLGAFADTFEKAARSSPCHPRALAPCIQQTLIFGDIGERGERSRKLQQFCSQATLVDTSELNAELRRTKLRPGPQPSVLTPYAVSRPAGRPRHNSRQVDANSPACAAVAFESLVAPHGARAPSPGWCQGAGGHSSGTSRPRPHTARRTRLSSSSRRCSAPG